MIELDQVFPADPFVALTALASRPVESVVQLRTHAGRR